MIDFAKLRAPFLDTDIEWRVQSAGLSKETKAPWAMILAYVDARAVQARLDEVCAPENWTVRYTHLTGGVMCDLSIKINNEWVTKSDGSPETDIEAFKGGISKAMVRTASIWGVGRYLYELPISWAKFDPKFDKKTPGAKDARIENKYYYWIPPVEHWPKNMQKPVHNPINNPAAMKQQDLNLKVCEHKWITDKRYPGQQGCIRCGIRQPIETQEQAGFSQDSVV